MPSRGRKGNFLLYLIGAIVVIVIVVMLLTKVGRQPAPLPAPIVDTQVQKLQTFSTSDDLSAIETDLTETNLDQIDAELTEVERDLGSL